VIDHTATRFDEVIDRVDLVFDTAGGDRLARSERARGMAVGDSNARNILCEARGAGRSRVTAFSLGQ
jgi:hypothetical protein